MTTANPQQRPSTLFYKFSIEVRPHDLIRRDDRIPMTCSFEEIAESEEEEVQLPERTLPGGRSPFAVAFESTFAERRETCSRDLSSTYARKFAIPRPGRGFSDPCLRRQQTSFIFGFSSPERNDAFLNLPPIPETASS